MDNSNTIVLSDLPDAATKFIAKLKCPLCKKILSTTDDSSFIYKENNGWIIYSECKKCDEYCYEISIINLKNVTLTSEYLTMYNDCYKFQVRLDYLLKSSTIDIEEKIDGNYKTVGALSLKYIFLNTKKRFNYKSVTEELTTMMLLS